MTKTVQKERNRQMTSADENLVLDPSGEELNPDLLQFCDEDNDFEPKNEILDKDEDDFENDHVIDHGPETSSPIEISSGKNGETIITRLTPPPVQDDSNLRKKRILPVRKGRESYFEMLKLLGAMAVTVFIVITITVVNTNISATPVLRSHQDQSSKLTHCHPSVLTKDSYREESCPPEIEPIDLWFDTMGKTYSWITQFDEERFCFCPGPGIDIPDNRYGCVPYEWMI
ncbi:MAG: hypothetical protein UU48_C0001G0068 [Candidatus Uhrbacteria bacterium GW2011_GWF2_41_16]|uniref:Uncharacterized protein n=2 Tax=Candidatus Uhriibacteriota TaxID=1752732 RepID=A0A0G0VCV3_9BACT|nr:MAG: hypothetical protein UU31_C0002G0120 [Candidatus Uhrbacteria bacterium GW2011_GWA2_41_10]KKR87774.1 MAG: hypothetical protein UU35_C0001G0055 [Candidatus Uhrbacteria bacterium GW2011_GWC2_41_11]KKR98713.1 MAG: hypothetical protein UU48_C0001G0068 [Candidatus Uhrbacteria bacterium GW2011_GWF2_41_16]